MSEGTPVRRILRDAATVVALIALYFVLMLFVLPRLGFNT